MLDGLEVTLVGSVGGMLARPDTLNLSATQIGWAGSAYVGGAVLGALYFGRLADRLGRKRLFLVTLAVYLVAAVATAFSFDFPTFLICRFFTGFGIGGEYAAINSAIDELIPARVRGRVNLAINGSFWIGAALGAALSLVLLDPRLFAPDVGWRIGFGLGALLAVAILLVRRHVPESPRWLLLHDRIPEAQREVARIETIVERQHGRLEPPDRTLVFTLRASPSLREIAHILLRRYPTRTVLGLALMISQAFFYNAIFFTYALVLTRFQGVPDTQVGLYIFPFAVANFVGPLVLGPLFDTIGRRRMIALTYGLSGAGLAATGYAFMQGWLDAPTQTLCWSLVFFLASAAASSAYLTVSEVFPLEMRALSISIFYAVGTGVGGFAAPAFFGMLIETGSRASVFVGYAIGSVLVIIAAVIALRYGVDAERKSLEEIAPSLSAESGTRH
ncbi:MAG: MFS transporter [Prolixibacteraceae bacterium]|nr:MFS transporter [Burkholderiales bacterium]